MLYSFHGVLHEEGEHRPVYKSEETKTQVDDHIQKSNNNNIITKYVTTELV